MPAGKAMAMALVATVAGCASPPVAPERSAADQQQLNRALQGRVAGAAVRCLPYFGSTDVQVIDDWTILFRQGGTVYVQNPQGGCPGIGSHRNTMVSRVWGNGQVCSGDIQHLVDMSTGIGGGACVFGPFVPYRKAS
jgi:hypothetical protein